MDKQGIANQIKAISIDDVERDMNKLIEIGKNSQFIGPRSRIGNNVVDHFTFVQRLETKGKYNISFYVFIQNIEVFKRKKFIKKYA
jgi:hypothetical protein